MTPTRLAAALLGTAALVTLLAATSGPPIAWHGTRASELRLSWRAIPERIETCRERTAEELAARPAHMRQPLECTGRAATYALTVAIGDASADSIVVEGGGARGDRPLFVLRRYPLEAGPRRVVVEFRRRERDVRTIEGRGAAAVPPVLRLDTLVDFRPGEATLVILERDRFALRTP